MCTPLFFFNDTATTEIYTLSLHDALPIYLPDLMVRSRALRAASRTMQAGAWGAVLRDGRVKNAASSRRLGAAGRDRKSTRLNSSHSQISYAVFCLKNKKTMSSLSRPQPRS